MTIYDYFYDIFSFSFLFLSVETLSETVETFRNKIHVIKSNRERFGKCQMK